ncbi:MAG: hypothetical protein WBP79_13050 [Candidatus Acidiferrales bacterium]
MQKRDAAYPDESRAWRDHFLEQSHTGQNFPWDAPARLSPAERAAITHSIQQFQLGEGANGKRLLRRSLAYGRAARDLFFVRALYLFIKEENRHSVYLLRFMHREGITAVSKHWVDTIFRRLRGLAGLELSLRVLVTAEIIAVPYYRALRDATKSALLKAICSRILIDEAAHLRFQASMLRRLGCRRGNLATRIVSRVHRVFLVGTSCLVWLEHGKVFRAAGYSLRRLGLESLAEFGDLDQASRARARQIHPVVSALRES